MKIDGGMPIQANLVNTGDMAQTLDVGDVFRAKIIAITANELVLKLVDGSQTKASTLVPLGFALGDFVDFQVKGADNGVITIQTVSAKTQDSPKLSELEMALASLPIKADPQTIQIVKTLLDNNIKVTEQSVHEISKLLENFKAQSLTPDKAVFLNQNNVPVNAENIHTLNSFLNKQSNLVNTFSDLTSKLSTLSEAQLTDVSNKLTVLESFEKLSSILAKVSIISSQSNQNVNNQNINAINIDNNEIVSKNIDEKNISNKNIDNISIDTKNINNKTFDIDKIINNNIKDLLKNPDFFSKLDKIDINIIKDILQKNLPLESLKSPKLEDSILDSKNLATKVLTDISEIENKRHDIAKRVFEGCFVNLSDDISSEDFDVKDIYRKILLRLEIIKDTVSNNSSPNSEMTNSIANFEKQLNFSNSINSNNTYVQVPINYEGQKNGELYIIKKKHSKSNEHAGTTVFLSLNTINIGRFETLVNITDNKLKINIRLEKDELINFVKKNYNIIYNLLEKTDFKIVDIKCKKIDEEINPINIESAIKNEFVSSSKSLDIKI